MANLNRDQIIAVEQSDRKFVRAKKIYIDMAGDLRAGIVLSEVLYWHLPSKTGKVRLRRIDGDKENLWLACARTSWYDRARLRPREFDTALEKLIALDLVKKTLSKYKGQDTLHLRINWPIFEERYNQMLSAQAAPSPRRRSKTSYKGIEDIWNFLIFLLKVSQISDTQEVSQFRDTPSPNGDTPSQNRDTVSQNSDTYTIIDTTIDTTTENQENLSASDDAAAPAFQHFVEKELFQPTEREKQQAATRYFFGLKEPVEANDWSHLNMLVNFFIGKMKPDPRRKEQSAWYEHQFSDAPFDAVDIIGLKLWYEDQYEDAPQLMKPATIEDKAGFYRLAPDRDRIRRRAERKLQRLMKPPEPEADELIDSHDLDAQLSNLAALARVKP
jgi:hypothetical protein